MNDYDEIVKLYIVGNSEVGKTTLSHRLCHNKFEENYDQTIGVDIHVKYLTNDKTYKMAISDCSGLATFISITRCYYKHSHGFVLVFDVTNRNSFNDIKNWLDDINNNTNDVLPKIMVGTKNDLKRVVSFEEAKELADSLNIEYFDISSKTSTDSQILNVFENLLQDVVRYNRLNKPATDVKLESGNCFLCSNCNIL